MDGAVNPTSVAISISMGTALLAGFFSVWAAMRSGKGAAVNLDAAVSILFGIAMLLILLFAIAAGLIAAAGMRYVGLLKAVVLLTAAFAVLGMVFGLRSARQKRPGGFTPWTPDRRAAGVANWQ